MSVKTNEKITIKKFTKKNRITITLLISTIISIILLSYLSAYLFKSYSNKSSLESDAISFYEKNKESIFYIDKIHFFSSADSENKTSSKNHFTIQNLYQFTDIAFFIESTSDEITYKNTLKKVYINNIQIEPPSLGTNNIFFKSLDSFTTGEVIDTHIILDTLEFEITSSNDIDLSSPILYNNLSNPITLSYINQNIKTDYTITDTSIPITYDGSLLERCQIPLTSISSKISFDIYITNNLDQEFKSTIFFEIPLTSTSTNNSSIYDGNITTTFNNIFNFYRYK